MGDEPRAAAGEPQRDAAAPAADDAAVDPGLSALTSVDIAARLDLPGRTDDAGDPPGSEQGDVDAADADPGQDGAGFTQPSAPAADDQPGVAREDPSQTGEDDGLATFAIIDVLSIHTDLPSQFPVVTIQEAEPPYRQLSLQVGMPEGAALAYAFRKLETPRPLTHELLASMLQRLHTDVIAVRLTGRRGTTYYAEVDLVGRSGRETFDCRPTDGITLALRLPVAAPILADTRLFDHDGDVQPVPSA